MINKKIGDIELHDLQMLIQNGVGEGKTLEYKQELQISKGDERKEFLADVTALANTDGGDLVFGIEEDRLTNLPKGIAGISIDGTEDEFIRQLESMIRDSVQPRIMYIEYRLIKIDTDDRRVLVMRIPASPYSPHRVEYQGHRQFYMRNTAGKYPMDVGELRAAFNSTQALADRVERFKIDRLVEIQGNRYNWLLEDVPYFVMQFMPTSAFLRPQTYSPGEIDNAMNSSNMNVFSVSGNRRITVDGIRVLDSFYGNMSKRVYGHFMSNGVIAVATTKFFNPHWGEEKHVKYIYCADLVKQVMDLVDKVKNYYDELDTALPVLISCAILNGRGYVIPDDYRFHSSVEIDRDLLVLPDIIINDWKTQTSLALKQLFDWIWNACGYEYCTAYDEEGKFIGFNW